MSHFKSEFTKDLVKKYFKPKTEETQNGTCVPDQGTSQITDMDNSRGEHQISRSKTKNDISIEREVAYKSDELPSLTEVTEAMANEVSKITTSKTLPKPNEDNWKEVLDLIRINPDDEYTEPPVCIEILDGDQSTRFGTLGNFSVNIGKAKSRKTFSVSLKLAAGLMEGNALQDKIKVTLPEGKKKIALFDTEQSKYDVSSVANRVLRLAGLHGTNENFEVLSARALTPAGRLFIIEKYIYETEDIGILVIDGIRDLIDDINSPSEATKITTRLLKWTQERNIHIIVVLHQNKGDNNARGHLGTEIVNKAESVISVEKDGLISIVKPEFCRGKDFSPFAFTVNNNLPEILPDWKESSNQEKGKKITYSTYSKETHLDVLGRIFSREKKYTYNKLVLAVKAEFESICGKFGRNKAVDFVTMYLANKFIKGEKEDAQRYQVYTLTQPV